MESRGRDGAGVGVEVDGAAAAVGAGDHGGDAHVEIGVGLALAVHAGKAVDQAGDEEFARAVDDARALGMGRSAREPTAMIWPSLTMTTGVLQIACGAAPVGDVDDGSAGENQRRGNGRLGKDWREAPETRPELRSTTNRSDPRQKETDEVA